MQMGDSVVPGKENRSRGLAPLESLSLWPLVARGNTRRGKPDLTWELNQLVSQCMHCTKAARKFKGGEKKKLKILIL